VPQQAGYQGSSILFAAWAPHQKHVFRNTHAYIYMYECKNGLINNVPPKALNLFRTKFGTGTCAARLNLICFGLGPHYVTVADNIYSRSPLFGDYLTRHARKRFLTLGTYVCRMNRSAALYPQWMSIRAEWARGTSMKPQAQSTTFVHSELLAFWTLSIVRNSK
jgi:hypothetical protein